MKETSLNGRGWATFYCWPSVSVPPTHTHKLTHTFGHGPEGGVNRLTGGWAISTVESNYFLKDSYVACLKRGGLVLRGHLRKWNSLPLAKGKVLPLRFDRCRDNLVSN